MFKENIIEFSSVDEYIENSKDILPIPSKLNIPKWFKNLKHSEFEVTAKGCMPFLDSLTAGYILKVPTDIYFLKEEKDGKIITKIEIANKNLPFLNHADDIKDQIHPTWQLKDSPLIKQNGDKAFFKILNPWIIKTPPGYSCLFLPPMNNNTNDFEIVCGIVDTDNYENNINFPIVFKKNDQSVKIKRGDPFVQVIPFKRESWKMKIKNTSKRGLMGFFTAFINNYKNRAWYKKRWI